MTATSTVRLVGLPARTALMPSWKLAASPAIVPLTRNVTDDPPGMLSTREMFPESAADPPHEAPAAAEQLQTAPLRAAGMLWIRLTGPVMPEPIEMVIE